MSEPRSNLGQLTDATTTALNAYARLHKYAPVQKAEILSIMQALLNVELAREHRAAQQAIAPPADEFER